MYDCARVLDYHRVRDEWHILVLEKAFDLLELRVDLGFDVGHAGRDHLILAAMQGLRLVRHRLRWGQHLCGCARGCRWVKLRSFLGCWLLVTAEEQVLDVSRVVSSSGMGAGSKVRLSISGLTRGCSRR